MTDGISNLPLRTFVKFKPLLTTVASSQLAASFDQMAESLKGASFSGITRFTLVGDPKTQSFTILVQERSAKVESDAKSPSEKADFEIITSPDIWLAIAEGKLAPLDAFTQGKMRVRGDYKLGQRIMKRLAVDGGRLGFC
jgi:putative sterol carrier protein